MQALFSVRQCYLPKAGFKKIASHTGEGGVNISPTTARVFWSYRNYEEHLTLSGWTEIRVESVEQVKFQNIGQGTVRPKFYRKWD